MAGAGTLLLAAVAVFGTSVVHGLLTEGDAVTTARDVAGSVGLFQLAIGALLAAGPWKPSTTLLTYRLTGTTGAFGVRPGRTLTSSSATAADARTTHVPQPRPIFASHGEPEGLYVADLREYIVRV